MVLLWSVPQKALLFALSSSLLPLFRWRRRRKRCVPSSYTRVERRTTSASRQVQSCSTVLKTWVSYRRSLEPHTIDLVEVEAQLEWRMFYSAPEPQRLHQSLRQSMQVRRIARNSSTGSTGYRGCGNHWLWATNITGDPDPPPNFVLAACITVVKKPKGWGRSSLLKCLHNNIQVGHPSPLDAGQIQDCEVTDLLSLSRFKSRIRFLRRHALEGLRPEATITTWLDVWKRFFVVAVAQNERTCSSPPNSPISEHGVDSRGAGGRLLPLRPIHLASRCHEEVLYTRLNRSCSINSAASIPTPLVEKNITASVASEPPSELDESPPTSITNDDQQDLDDDGGRVMVDLDAIEVVSNLDEVCWKKEINGHTSLLVAPICSATTNMNIIHGRKTLQILQKNWRQQRMHLQSRVASLWTLSISQNEDGYWLVRPFLTRAKQITELATSWWIWNLREDIVFEM